MTAQPLKLLNEAIRILKSFQYRFALAGGLAASFYRLEPRLTKDVDITLLAENDEDAELIAIELLEKLSLKPAKAIERELNRAPGMNKKRSPVVIVTGTVENSISHSGLDVILPTIPWVREAVLRAQNNLIEFSFAKVPVITVEDLIVAKLFSYSDNISRYKDLDDIQNIFARSQNIDFVYLASTLEKHKLLFPYALKKEVPKILKSYVAKKK